MSQVSSVARSMGLIVAAGSAGDLRDPVRLGQIASPVGPLTLAADGEDRLVALMFGTADDQGAAAVARALPRASLIADSALPQAADALGRYFGREPGAFDHLPLRLYGTPFQCGVWQALADIPFGTTISYGTLAQRLGSPKAVRAVGRANGANPLSIILPCHRVIGANGSLTGYGGGLPRKSWLLAFEAPQLPLTSSISGTSRHNVPEITVF